MAISDYERRRLINLKLGITELTVLFKGLSKIAMTATKQVEALNISIDGISTIEEIEKDMNELIIEMEAPGTLPETGGNDGG